MPVDYQVVYQFSGNSTWYQVPGKEHSLLIQQVYTSRIPDHGQKEYQE